MPISTKQEGADLAQPSAGLLLGDGRVLVTESGTGRVLRIALAGGEVHA